MPCFRFEKYLVAPGEGENSAHAELSFGNGMITLGSVKKSDRFMNQPDDIGGAETQTPYIIVSAADAIYARAKSAAPESFSIPRTKTTARVAFRAAI